MNDLIGKHDHVSPKLFHKLNDTELKVLKAILVVNICRFAFIDKEDAKTALAWCSNVRDADLDSPVEYEVVRMTASSCSGWLSQTQALPDYLDQQTVKRYHDLRHRVEQRLHNCRVQGVVSMFNELTSEEKEECLKILQKTN